MDGAVLSGFVSWAFAYHSLIILTCCIAMATAQASRWLLAVGEAVPDRTSVPHASQLAECKAMTHTYSVRPPSPTAPRQRTGCANTCLHPAHAVCLAYCGGHLVDSLDVPLRRSPPSLSTACLAGTKKIDKLPSFCIHFKRVTARTIEAELGCTTWSRASECICRTQLHRSLINYASCNLIAHLCTLRGQRR